MMPRPPGKVCRRRGLVGSGGQFEQDRAHRVAHDFVEYVAQRLALVLQFRDQRGEHAEVAFLRVERHRGQARRHGEHEALMGVGDLPVEVAVESGAGHRRSIGSARRVINALLVVLALAAIPAQAARVPGTGGAVEVGGWIDASGVIDTAGGPYQGPWGRLLLAADADLGHGLGFGLQLLTQAGGPYHGAQAGVYGFGAAFENDSPSLQVDEAYLGWQLPAADLRAGLQLFAWGKLDGVPPTDVLNPRSYHDPIVGDGEERKIGVPALSGTYYVQVPSAGALSRLEAQLVYVPIAVPPRLALERERWFPSSAVAGDRITQGQLAAAGVALPFGVPIDLRTESDAPARTLGNGAIGARLGGTWRAADWDLYYYGGPETNPDARLTATVFPGPSGTLRVESALEQELTTIHMFGGDTAFVVGPVSLRAEAAYFKDRPYLRPGIDVLNAALTPQTLAKVIGGIDRHGYRRIALEPLFVELDAVEWGIGADLVWEGFHPLVQLSQVVPVESAPPLLIGDPDTRITAHVSKPVWQERVELEVRTVYSIESGGWFALPRVSWVPRDDLRLRLGYLAIGGHRESLIGQFKSNDEVVADVRWSF